MTVTFRPCHPINYFFRVPVFILQQQPMVLVSVAPHYFVFFCVSFPPFPSAPAPFFFFFASSANLCVVGFFFFCDTQYIDVLGTAFNEVSRPAPLHQHHVDNFMARKGLGFEKITPQDLKDLQQEVKELLDSGQEVHLPEDQEMLLCLYEKGAAQAGIVPRYHPWKEFLPDYTSADSPVSFTSLSLSLPLSPSISLSLPISLSSLSPSSLSLPFFLF